MAIRLSQLVGGGGGYKLAEGNFFNPGMGGVGGISTTFTNATSEIELIKIEGKGVVIWGRVNLGSSVTESNSLSISVDGVDLVSESDFTHAAGIVPLSLVGRVNSTILTAGSVPPMVPSGSKIYFDNELIIKIQTPATASFQGCILLLE